MNELITKKSTNSCFRKKINGYTTQYLLFIPKWVFGWFSKKKSGFLAYYNNENLEKIINGKNQ